MQRSSRSRVLAIFILLLLVLIVINASSYIKNLWNLIEPNKVIQATVTPSPTPTLVTTSATMTVNGQRWGTSTCYIGATEGSSTFNINDLLDLGINAYHIYGGMSRWEAQDDSSHYGTPTIDQIKADPNVINWQQWDTIMTNPPDGSDYWWEPAPRWQGNARTLFSTLQQAHIRPILVLRNRDDQNKPSWSPNPPRTAADWNEWWEHVFATVYWLNVRNHYNVTDFEILNEPNIPQQGWTPQATEADYFTLAQYTSDAINFVFHTYLPGMTYHIDAPTTSGGTWPKDALQQIPQDFDSMDVHDYSGNYRTAVERVHEWMNQAGHSQMPLWVSEWGSYQGQYNQEPFGVSMLSSMIYSSFPGNDYVYGSLLFALYDYSTNATGLIDYHDNRRIDYYAVRMGIQALQGCRPTYKTTSSTSNLVAITTIDQSKNVYLLVTNQSSVSYKVQVNFSSLLRKASGTILQFDSHHPDSVVGKLAVDNGTTTLVIPASSAVMVKLTGSPSL